MRKFTKARRILNRPPYDYTQEQPLAFVLSSLRQRRVSHYRYEYEGKVWSRGVKRVWIICHVSSATLHVVCVWVRGDGNNDGRRRLLPPTASILCTRFACLRRLRQLQSLMNDQWGRNHQSTRSNSAVLLCGGTSWPQGQQGQHYSRHPLWRKLPVTRNFAQRVWRRTQQDFGRESAWTWRGTNTRVNEKIYMLWE